MERINFKDLDVSKEILQAVEDMGFEEATPIQSIAIPPVLEGKDVVGQAQTGTGKTAAFGIPMLDKIDTGISPKQTQALILCPTRELAMQVAEEMGKLSKYKKDVRIVPIYGGQPIERQITALKKGSQIVVGTPGRVMDHMRRKTLKLNDLKMMILDEADEMLNMGFREDIELILESVPVERQTLLFSATMPKAILNIINQFQNDPIHLKVEHKELTTPNVEQFYMDVREKDKLEVLTRILDVYKASRTMIFCNTKRKTDEVSDSLQLRGYMADKIHGDMTQQLRTNVLNRFKRGDIEVLVATDVAARGIDVEGIDSVVNFDMPTHEEYYVHRIGRTGRAGKHGKAYSFLTAREVYVLKNIVRYTKKKMERLSIPTISDIESTKTENFLEKFRKEMQGSLSQKYVRIVEKLIDEDFSPVEVAATLLKMELEANVERSEIKDVEHMVENNSGGAKKVASKNMTRLFLSIGKKQKVSPKDIVGAIAGETSLPSKKIGDIQLYDNFSFVEIPSSHVEEIVSKISKTRIKRFRVSVEIAKEDKNAKRSRGTQGSNRRR